MRKIRRLSLLPPLTIDNLEPMVDDWAEMLYGIIPHPYLYPCYLEAYRTHKPGFTMECAELLQVWYRTQVTVTPTQTYAASCTLCRAHNEDLELPPCTFHQVMRVTRTMEEDAGPPGTYLDDKLHEILGERCIATNTAGELTVRCQLLQGHEGRHTFNFAPQPRPEYRCSMTHMLWVGTQQEVKVKCLLLRSHDGEHKFWLNNNQGQQGPELCPQCTVPIGAEVVRGEQQDENKQKCPHCDRLTLVSMNS